MLAPVVSPSKPSVRSFSTDVVRGLERSPKELPCKYFYDKRGSLLFDEICKTDDYYLTRAETGLLEAHVGTLVRAMGPGATLVELGSGSSHKTQLLLDRATDLARYVPIDISARHLEETAQALRARYPRIEVRPLALDYAAPLPALDGIAADGGRRVVFFPGSSIGNFEPAGARRLLAEMANVAGPEGLVIVGVDVPKDAAVIERAYNDRAGVTARFNRNLLERINRELHGDFDVKRFAHRAEWQAEPCRVEMQLVSEAPQRVTVGGRAFEFGAGEAIVTEHCYKWSPERFAALAERADLRSEEVLFDERRLVSMHILRPLNPGRSSAR
jgi:dimethylhistidine N-methyltransferase